MLVDPSSPEDAEARAVVEWWRDEHVEPMLEVYDAVRREADEVSYRLKQFRTTIDKLVREPVKLADMVDLGGVRAVVETADALRELQRALAASLETRRTRDWASSPRSSGYRAVHLHVRCHGRMVEVQLRTRGQHLWANLVEEETLLSGLDYKSGEGHPAVLRFYALMADFIAAVETGESHPGLQDRLVEAYHEARPFLRVSAFANLWP